MTPIYKEETLEKIKKEQRGFDVSLSPVQLAMYEGLLIAEDIVRHMPEASDKEKRALSYERLLLLAKRMHGWIYDHSFDEKREYKKIGLTDEEHKLLGYFGGLTISAIDGK